MLRERSWIETLFIALLVAALFGCSSGNSDVSILDNSHSNFALGAFSAATAHGPLAKAALQDCQSCHAAPTYGANPRFTVSRTNIPSGCETCHKAFTAHPTPWLPERIGTPGNIANTTSHTSAGSVTTGCALCHGASLDGVGGSAPSCMSSDPLSGVRCHAASPVQTPTGCTSCHAASPSGPNDASAGAKSPNREFGHLKHAKNLAMACAVCHGSFTSGMASHADDTTDVPLSNTYKANFTVNVTSFSYDKTARTCSGISCHGGQTTPDWQAANSIIVATGCLQCHGTGQNNSYTSVDKHAFHLTGNGNTIYKNKLDINPNKDDMFCTDCHKMDKPGSLHFAGLDTPAMDSAGDTVGDPSIKATEYKSDKTCTTACHLIGGKWY